jgi:hypothetical protein
MNNAAQMCVWRSTRNDPFREFLARGMCRVVRIEQQHTPPHSTQDQGGGKPGRAAADYRDVEPAHEGLMARSEMLLTPYLAQASRARFEMNR